MEAVILAGGFGTRLRPLTYTRSKSLLPIMNKPMISYLVEQLPKEVDKIILAVNYRKEEIEKSIAEMDLDVEVIVNDEPRPLGTGGAVKFAEKHITGSFFVLNSDIISSLDMEEMLSFHKKNDGFATISLWPVENVSEFGVVELGGNRILSFVEKPRPEEAPSNLINAGAYLLEREVLNYIEEEKMVSMEKEIFPKIIEDEKNFLGFQIKDYWIDVGRISSYHKVHQMLMKKGGLDKNVGVGCEVNGDLKKSSIGNRVLLKRGSTVENSIVFDYVEIGENSRVKDSVVGEGVKIGKNSDLENVVVGDNEKIDDGSILKDEKIWTKEVPEGYPNKQIGNAIKR